MKRLVFLSWAGGKYRIVNKLIKLIPNKYLHCTYREPFLGAGSMFFTLKPKKSYLSDLNDHLINCYSQIKINPELLYEYLLGCIKKNSKDFYYKTREQYNSNLKFNVEKAAQFIYLNKTAFNGIFRVNKKSKFNVPYGNKKNPIFPELCQLKEVSQLLQDAVISQSSYKDSLRNSKSGDFIYLDPPYPPLNGTSYFTHYTKERFYENDQIDLANIAYELNKKGCYILLTNADIPMIHELYKNWNIIYLPVTRWITCKKKKHQVSELAILNYNL